MSDLPRCKSCMAEVGQLHQASCSLVLLATDKVRWEDSRFDPLDPSSPISHVDAFIRDSGGDPKQVAQNGQRFVKALLAAKECGPREVAALIPLLRLLREMTEEGEGEVLGELFNALPDKIKALSHLEPMP